MTKQKTTGRFPTIVTRRLQMRQLTHKDLEKVYRHFSDPQVCRFIELDPLTSPDQADLFIIKAFRSLFVNHRGIYWGIFLKDKSQFIGTCGYQNWTGTNTYQAEIGFDLDAQYWGKGIMREAVQAIVQFGFEKMKLNRIEALVAPENLRSQKLIKKLGFQQEGLLREHAYYHGTFTDELVFSLLKKDWAIRETTTGKKIKPPVEPTSEPIEAIPETPESG